MKTSSQLLLLAFLLLPNFLISQFPVFQSRGIGGGGALFSPATNPANGSEMYFASDLGGLYHTTNGGQSYDVVHFTEAITGNYGKVCFSQNNTRYTLLYDENNFDYRPANDLGALFCRVERSRSAAGERTGFRGLFFKNRDSAWGKCGS